MTFKQAIKLLGGPSAASKASKVPRTVIIYWLKNGVSRFRKDDERRIIELAESTRQRAA